MAYQFKSTLPAFSVLIKTCIAFGNASGGRILIGVDGESREIIGAKSLDRHAFSLASSSTHRSLTVDFEKLTPQSCSVMAETLRVDTPFTYISINPKTNACSER